jgi:serine/threonine-protein kinase PRP4
MIDVLRADMWSVGVVLVEILSGKLLYPGADNNAMIKYFLDYWGAPAKKVLKRGVFSSIYFDDEGLFLHRAVDPQLGRTVTRKLKVVKTSRDLLSFISGCSSYSLFTFRQNVCDVLFQKGGISGSEDRDALMSLKDLLTQMFIIDPTRRIVPTAALAHGFCKK